MSLGVVNDISNIQTLIGAVGAIVGGITTAAIQHYTPNTNTLLEGCRRDLEDIKARLNEIPEERREKINAAVKQKQCESLEKLEQDLIKFVPSTNMSMSMSLRDFICPAFLMIAGTSAIVPTHPGNVICR